MALPFKNEYTLKTVNEASAKPCMVCLKSSNKVLITSDKKDFFYICIGHTQDRGFASPVIDEKAQAEQREKEALQQEIELVKKEYEEKLKKKGKKKEDPKKDAVAETEQERDAKIKSLETKATAKSVDAPQSFVLQKSFFQMRLDRVRKIEQEKRKQERIRDPKFFPSAPTGGLPAP